MVLLINGFFSFIEFLAGLSLANVLFRLPFEKNKRLKHILISLFLACDSVYFSTYWHNPLITFSFTLFLWIISLVVVFQISIWYSMLIGIISALIGGLLEYIGFSIANLIQPNEVTRNFVLFAITVILYLLSIYLGKKKFGYHIRNIYSKPPLNKLFFIVSLIMIFSLLVLVISGFTFHQTVGVQHIVIALSLLICTTLVVYYTYKYNKKIIQDKYRWNDSKPWN